MTRHDGGGRPETPTRILRDQHRNILKVADVLGEILAHEPGSGVLDFDALADCIAFIRLYADALHHGEEEDLLFPELEAVGLPRETGPIAVMLQEHRQGRAFASTMAGALEPARSGDGAALSRLIGAAHGYIELIRGHILKEDHVLFEMADQMIEPSTCRSLCAAYEGVCQRRFEGCTVMDLEALLARLVEAYPEA